MKPRTSLGLVALLTAVFFLVSMKIRFEHLKMESWGKPRARGSVERREKMVGLPSGIVEEYSDMELRPLWDDQKLKDNSENHTALLAMAVGISQKQNVDTIVRKFLMNNCSTILFHYDGNVDGWHDLRWSKTAIHIVARNQTKWWFAKRFLHPDVISIYDYIFLWDEDLGVQNFHPRRRRPQSAEKRTLAVSDEDAIANLMNHHEQFLNSAQSRLMKLQIINRLWKRDDIKAVINAVETMSDHSVSADVFSVLLEKSDRITLDLCTSVLPLLTSLLESNMDRHLGISLEMLVKLVRTFGPVIHSTLSAAPSVGVDLQAEQRLERCNLCFVELEKVRRSLPLLTRRGGSITKSAQELNLTLREVL